MRYHRILTFSLLLAGLTIEVRAQGLPDATIRRIRAASQVRVLLAGGGQGTLYTPVADSVSLSYSGSRFHRLDGRVGPPPSPLLVTDLARIQVPHGSHWREGARLGAAIGLGISLLAVAVTSGDEWVAPTTGQAVQGVIAWSAIGAGVGAVLGATSRRWTTVYQPR